MHKPTKKSLISSKKMDSLSPVVKSFLAGSFSGTCSTILFQPFDLIKTRIQTVLYTPGSATGLLQVTTNVYKNDRLIGLWKGTIPSLARTVPGIGVYFSTLHTLKSNFGSADPHPVESVALGMTARTASGISMLPVTVVKTRFESGKYEYKGMSNALITIYRAEGLRGLYSGLAPTLLRDAPFSGLYLLFYTQAKKHVKKLGLQEPLAPSVHFTCGLVAGCVASIVTQPVDVIKTHMQLRPTRFSTVHSTLLYVYQLEGTRGFLRGVLPRTMRRTLMAALAWTVYEEVMKTVGIA